MVTSTKFPGKCEVTALACGSQGVVSGDAAGCVCADGAELARLEQRVLAVALAGDRALVSTSARVAVLDRGQVVPVGSKGHAGNFSGGFFHGAAEMQVRSERLDDKSDFLGDSDFCMLNPAHAKTQMPKIFNVLLN